MENSPTVADLVAYLDSVRDLYPSGVPEPLVGVAAAAVAVPDPELLKVRSWGDRLAPLVIVTDLSEELAAAGTPFSGERGLLLESALTKGAKFSIESVRLVLASPQERLGAKGLSELAKNLKAEIFSGQVRLIMVLGELLGEAAVDRQVRRGEWCSRNGVDILVTHQLAAILASKEAKREFWLDLQSLVRKGVVATV